MQQMKWYNDQIGIDGVLAIWWFFLKKVSRLFVAHAIPPSAFFFPLNSSIPFGKWGGDLMNSPSTVAVLTFLHFFLSSGAYSLFSVCCTRARFLNSRMRSFISFRAIVRQILNLFFWKKILSARFLCCRRLCILKGVFPRNPKNKFKGADKIYYLKKDIQFLMHDPILKTMR